jgi:hypothetical protein
MATIDARPPLPELGQDVMGVGLDHLLHRLDAMADELDLEVADARGGTTRTAGFSRL